MLTLIKLTLPFLAILGFSSFFSRLVKLPLAILLFSTTALLGLLQFIFAMTGSLKAGTMMVLTLGCLTFIYTGITDFFQRNGDPKAKEKLITLGFYLIFAALIAGLAFGLRFRIIDDYSFWGMMSKYLFIFHQLPSNHEYISENFLTYTPGMACFHYLFYFAAGQYSQFAGYLAQGAVLLSALMVLFDPKRLSSSLGQMALAYILLSLGFGAVFARMEVDAYVAVYVFAISFILYQAKENMVYSLFFPLLFLPLIKEIGLFFAMILGLALWLSVPKSRKDKVFVVLLFGFLLLLKFCWQLHCQHYGFKSFATAIHFNNAMAALNPFNSDFYQARMLFIKTVFLGRFSQLAAWPNFVSYLILTAIWFYLARRMDPQNYRRASLLKWLYIAAILIYLIMLYLLEALVFEVGRQGLVLLAFQRYFNMLFIPFILFSVLIYYQERQALYGQKFASSVICALALIGILSGKIERSRHYYEPDTVMAMVASINKRGDFAENKSLCLQGVPEPSYETLLPLKYFLLPKKIKLLDTPQSCHYMMEWPPKVI